MSIDKLIADISKNDLKLALQITISDVKPLIMELNYKFGLVVVCKVDNKHAKNREAYLMAYPSGIAVGEVFVEQVDDYDAYCYFTPFYEKDRASGHSDRHTIRSKKISTLMGTLKSKGVVVREEDIIKNNFYPMFSRTVSMVTDKIQHSNKHHQLRVDQIHTLLRMAIGDSTNTKPSDADIESFRKTLEDYNKSDDTQKLITEERRRFYGNAFYGVCALVDGYYLVGKFKSTGKEDNYKNMYETLEPIRLVKDFESEPELHSLMVMLKVAVDEGRLNDRNTPPEMVGLIPRVDIYDEVLDMVIYWAATPTKYSGVWMLTPCQ